VLPRLQCLERALAGGGLEQLQQVSASRSSALLLLLLLAAAALTLVPRGRLQWHLRCNESNNNNINKLQ
jgi:hypothetical protein